VAPAGAAYAKLYVMRNNSAINDWCMVAHPMFCECPANASAITPWQPAGQTVLEGSGITTGSITADKMSVANLSAISANLGTVTAGTLSVGSGGVTIQSGSSGARIVISNSLISVYDASNVLRVRLGIW
jgi:hypothetical protein